MKALLLVVCLLAAPWAVAQEASYQFSPLPLDKQTHEVVYAGTVAVPLAVAEQLQDRLQTWTGGPGSKRGAWQLAAGPRHSTRVIIRQGQEQYAGELTLRVHDGSYAYHLTHLTYTRPGYAQAGKYTPAQIVTRVEQLVYSRPSGYRTRKLNDIHALVQRLLASLQQTMQTEADLVLQKGS